MTTKKTIAAFSCYGWQSAKQGQLAFSISFGLLRIDQIISEYCIYCTILTGPLRGGITVEYASTITVIPNTEDLKVF